MEGDHLRGTMEQRETLSLSTRLVMADGEVDGHAAIAPGLHTSTNFRYNDDPEKLIAAVDREPGAEVEQHIYSRHTSPNMARLETLLTSLLGARAMTYSSGLAAFHAVMVRLNPRRIAMGDGYHGCRAIVGMMSRLTGVTVLPLDCAASELGPGDVIHVETPWNPTGEARNLVAYAAKARSAGAWLTVDATLAPPPLQDPFAFGADVVMHSATKYLGGHSDMLCGVVAVRGGHERERELVSGFLEDRLLLGSVPGSLEGWLGMRSLRTLELRVGRQSETARGLVAWLVGEMGAAGSAVRGRVVRVRHASLQDDGDDEGWLRRQMPGGFGAVFAVYMATSAQARALPSRLRLFQHATSLGGVESLVEWRAMTDPTADECLLRVSVGLEALEDLQADLLQGLQRLG